MAGLWEGEGSFYVLKTGFNRSSGRRVDYRYARASMTMTDLDVLERFQGLAGVGRIVTRTDRGPAQGLKRQYVYVVDTQAEVIELASWLRPLLGARRQEQIAKVLSEACGRVVAAADQVSLLPN